MEIGYIYDICDIHPYSSYIRWSSTDPNEFIAIGGKDMKKKSKKSSNAALWVLVGVMIAMFVVGASFAMSKGALNTFTKANKKAAESATALFE